LNELVEKWRGLKGHLSFQTEKLPLPAATGRDNKTVTTVVFSLYKRVRFSGKTKQNRSVFSKNRLVSLSSQIDFVENTKTAFAIPPAAGHHQFTTTLTSSA
jgi:hypothetical protein